MNGWTDKRDPVWDAVADGRFHPDVVVVYRHCGWSAWRCWLARTLFGHHHIVDVAYSVDEQHVWNVEE